MLGHCQEIHFLWEHEEHTNCILGIDRNHECEHLEDGGCSG